jgi:hypothetical protein
MTRREEPSGAEVLRLLYYIVGQDQAVARAELRSQTADIVAQSKQTMAKSRELLARIEVPKSGAGE